MGFVVDDREAFVKFLYFLVFLYSSHVVDKDFRHKLFLCQLFKVSEGIDGLLFVPGNILLGKLKIYPPDIILYCYFHVWSRPTLEVFGPSMEIEKLPLRKLTAPKLVTYSIKVSFSERRLLEKNFVFVSVYPNNYSILPKEFRLHANYLISYR